MSRMRVLVLNLHQYQDGSMVAVFDRHWRGARKDDVLIRRVYVEGPGLDSSPGHVLRALADLLDGRATDPA